MACAGSENLTLGQLFTPFILRLCLQEFIERNNLLGRSLLFLAFLGLKSHFNWRCGLIFVKLDLGPEDIVSLVSIEAAKDIQPVLFAIDYALVERAGGRLEVVDCDPPGPHLRLKQELMHVIESLLLLVDPTEHIQR